MREPKRGEVWFGDFEPVRGHEQGGRRPCLIISDDDFNRSRADLVIVLPISTKRKGVPTHVEITPPEAGVTRTGWVKCEDIRSISKDRISHYWGTVSDKTVAEVEYSLKTLLRLWEDTH